MPENMEGVAVFLGNSSNESKVQQYASTNGLRILYIFNTKTSSARVSPRIIRKELMELVAILKGKRSVTKRLFMSLFMRTTKALRCLKLYLKWEHAFDNMAFMTMLEYVTEYKQCQGLLVYDVKDLSPQDLSVVRWTIDRLRGANKKIYSVVPYVYESLPQYKGDRQANFDRKWSELIATCDFYYRTCPPIISICVFENQCFCRCRFCYQVKNPEAVKEEYMDFVLFKKILNDLPPHERLNIVLGPGGEPLTYPKIHEMVRYVTDMRPLALTEYSTNGILMNHDQAVKIIESGLKRIQISLNAPTPEDYKWFAGIDAYEKVLNNVKGLIKLRCKLGGPIPFVRLKIMGMKRWADKVERFVSYWRGIVNETIVAPVSYYQDEEFENIESLKPSRAPLIPICFYLWNNIIIMPNGRYQFCCAPDFSGDKYGPVELGNARDKKLIDVWCGEEYIKLRRINAQGLPIFANCLSCGINLQSFESDLIIKAKVRKLLKI